MLAKGIEILDCASERAGDAAAPRWPAVLSLYGIVLLAGFGGSYAIQFLNLGLQQRGLSGSAIGLSTATQALGIVIAACVAVPVLNRLGSAPHARARQPDRRICARRRGARREHRGGHDRALRLRARHRHARHQRRIRRHRPDARRAPGDRGRRLRHGLCRRHGAGAGDHRPSRLRRHAGASPRRRELLSRGAARPLGRGPRTHRRETRREAEPSHHRPRAARVRRRADVRRARQRPPVADRRVRGREPGIRASTPRRLRPQVFLASSCSRSRPGTAPTATARRRC